MTGFSKVPRQPSTADPHLRLGRPLRDRRADARSHIRGYRSSCGPHLASSGAAAGGSLGVARAGLPVRIGNGAPPSPGLGPAISRDAGGPSRAGVAARRIAQSLRRGPSPGAPRSLIARRSSGSSLEARPSIGAAPASPWVARTGTATRARAYRFGTFDVKWQCGWRCPVRSPPSGSVGGAVPYARRQVAVHIYVSSRQAQTRSAEGPQARSRGGGVQA